MIDSFNECIGNRIQLTSKMPLLKGQVIEPLKAKEKASKAKSDVPELVRAEAVYKRSEAIIAEFDAFSKNLTTIPEGKDYSPLFRAAIRQQLDGAGRKISHLLYLNVISTGGEAITSRGVFRWGRRSFLGGCVVSYILATCDGAVIDADTIFGCSYAKFNLNQKSPPTFEM